VRDDIFDDLTIIISSYKHETILKSMKIIFSFLSTFYILLNF